MHKHALAGPVRAGFIMRCSGCSGSSVFLEVRQALGLSAGAGCQEAFLWRGGGACCKFVCARWWSCLPPPALIACPCLPSRGAGAKCVFWRLARAERSTICPSGNGGEAAPRPASPGRGTCRVVHRNATRVERRWALETAARLGGCSFGRAGAGRARFGPGARRDEERAHPEALLPP